MVFRQNKRDLWRGTIEAKNGKTAINTRSFALNRGIKTGHGNALLHGPGLGLGLLNKVTNTLTILTLICRGIGYGERTNAYLEEDFFLHFFLKK